MSKDIKTTPKKEFLDNLLNPTLEDIHATPGELFDRLLYEGPGLLIFAKSSAETEFVERVITYHYAFGFVHATSYRVCDEKPFLRGPRCNIVSAIDFDELRKCRWISWYEMQSFQGLVSPEDAV